MPKKSTLKRILAESNFAVSDGAPQSEKVFEAKLVKDPNYATQPTLSAKRKLVATSGQVHINHYRRMKGLYKKFKNVDTLAAYYRKQYKLTA